MRAILTPGPGEVEVADVAEPDPGSAVLVRARRVGICGTDTKIVSGKIPVSYPRILGHEMVGEVVDAPVGSSFASGDRVLVDPAVWCGRCVMCLEGRSNICLEGGLLGRDADGVFADYSAVPPERVIAIPEGISDTAASLLQVLGTCVHALDSITVAPGAVAAVIGLGVSGQLISQLLTNEGFQVVGITRSEWKRRLAERAGVATAHPDRADRLLAEMTSGLGPRLVVEAVGMESTLAASIEMVATGGEVVVFGTLTGGGSGLPYYQLYHKELVVHNPRAAVVDDYVRAVTLAASDALDLEPLVTDVFGLEEAAAAFDRVGADDTLKVVMTV